MVDTPKSDTKALSWTEDTYDDRPTRPCMSCGQRDKAPRDQVGLPDGNVAYYHKDCHAMLGCKICEEELKTIAGGSGPKGKKNEALWMAIVDAINPETGPVPDVYTRDDVSGAYEEALYANQIVDTNWRPQ